MVSPLYTDKRANVLSVVCDFVGDVPKKVNIPINNTICETRFNMEQKYK